MLEQIIAKRICGDAEVPEVIISLLQGAKEGHLCHLLTEPFLCKENGPLVVDGNRLYLQRNWMLETLILQKIKELLALPAIGLEGEWPQLQESQAKAIRIGSQKMLTIFTGGPGTGKTYTASYFIRLLNPNKVLIAAPTGKAAAHLESALLAQGSLEINYESTTLHRLLKLQPGMQRFYSTRQLDADLVVIDEASMLDPSLLLQLLNAIGPATRLLLLGDPDQLPPVEGGSLFPEIADLLGQKLERSMRMGDGPLFALSQAILRGEQIPSEQVDWSHIVDRLCQELPAFSTDPLQCLQEQKRFRILGALRQGPYGVDTLNREILSRYKGASIPILITQNDPRQQLYNGTTGVLIGKIAYFQFPDGLHSIPEGKLPRFEPAFCLSVHKSQGSEFDEVLALFPPGSERFGKEALYTAVTRAKKSVKLLMDNETLGIALKTTGRKRSGFTARW